MYISVPTALEVGPEVLTEVRRLMMTSPGRGTGAVFRKVRRKRCSDLVSAVRMHESLGTMFL